MSQPQLERVDGDSGTIIPDHLTRPAHWPVVKGHLNGKYVGPETERERETEDSAPEAAHTQDDIESPYSLPKDKPSGDAVSTRDGQLFIDPAPVPERDDLRDIFEDLTDDVAALRETGGLANIASTLSRALDRFAKTLPDELDELRQVRFGVQTRSLRMRFDAFREELAEIDPERVGDMQAILGSAELIAARLPDWISFLAETEDEEATITANGDSIDEDLHTATQTMRFEAEVFDPSIPDSLEEYAETETPEARVAATRLIVNVAWRFYHWVGRRLKVASDALEGSIYVIGFVKVMTPVINRIATTVPAKFQWLSDGLQDLLRLLG